MRLCWILALSLACQSSSAPDIKALHVLSDFVFAGSGSAKLLSNGDIDIGYVTPHSLDEQPKPKSLEVGVQYIFHYGGTLNNEKLAFTDLPAKLRALGFEVIKAPKTPSDLSYPSYAGPMFSISFSDGKHKGIIYNRIDGKLGGSRSYKNEDYILVFLH